MYGATRGVNTHKGAIFSLGILAASAARVAAGAGGGGRDFSAEAALDCAAAMCSGLVRAELEPAAHFPGPSPTAGERQFREHGCRGARGQAEDGFPAIRLCALPILRSARGRAPRAERVARLDALLSVIAVLEDSCILKRGGPDALAFARREAGSILAAGGASAIGGMAALRRLDRTFCERGLSPGGAADMLAGGIFLDRLEAELHAEEGPWERRGKTRGSTSRRGRMT
jgi:triphosphoribosyl-dephospho-CoA synthetase